ncbi:hypothetical protein B0J17DRAFT_680604 [Rhizoctonia solani]|nr:hypothetical protein B0J17DRAFT_680604 [Rhizoctonia solani]
MYYFLAFLSSLRFCTSFCVFSLINRVRVLNSCLYAYGYGVFEFPSVSCM